MLSECQPGNRKRAKDLHVGHEFGDGLFAKFGICTLAPSKFVVFLALVDDRQLDLSGVSHVRHIRQGTYLFQVILLLQGLEEIVECDLSLDGVAGQVRKERVVTDIKLIFEDDLQSICVLSVPCLSRRIPLTLRQHPIMNQYCPQHNPHQPHQPDSPGRAPIPLLPIDQRPAVDRAVAFPARRCCPVLARVQTFDGDRAGFVHECDEVGREDGTEDEALGCRCTCKASARVDSNATRPTLLPLFLGALSGFCFSFFRVSTRRIRTRTHADELHAKFAAEDRLGFVVKGGEDLGVGAAEDWGRDQGQDLEQSRLTYFFY